MAKLRLIIADNDKAYVESVSNYIINNYSHRFQINSFTEEQYFLDYISKNNINIDILLICPQWYTDLIPKEKICISMILSEGIFNDEVIDCEVINKYQRGDKLVSNIINSFVEKNPNKYYIEHNSKRSKVIAVYSPIGGMGKTSIAIGSCLKSAQEGRSVFYLNLENIQSTPRFFDCESSQNLSNILYYIKEKKKNITLKIEGIRCKDSQYNIHYFTPPDSCIDLNETSINEIQYLINELKTTNDYDDIFIDTTSILDEKNKSVLMLSDQVILLVGQDDLSMTKLNLFVRELDILSKRNDLDLSNKITIVLNKYIKGKAQQIKELNLWGKSIDVKVPDVYEPIYIYENSFRKGMKREFKNAISEILTRIYENTI
ncbi:AAA family ATPase [Paramaledivibacter caminithermalis]|uniref:Cellulose biosynthesis protein BcsQ n=1 Tax=Paramaledivibacter caminithermalis (strain DSM 15212 / CIP 107654 / DViRD3) TaxID=1121301 RepID=A0A1M6PHH9_PARC5|nr:AAA family ATPase [Paramaledivibacter caminithermalis]SHK07409.1 Cellulose biosynthesis protein BcsQ [Paramaledivibacter caminithermalis DSM 15212]